MSAPTQVFPGCPGQWFSLDVWPVSPDVWATGFPRISPHLVFPGSPLNLGRGSPSDRQKYIYFSGSPLALGTLSASSLDLWPEADKVFRVRFPGTQTHQICNRDRSKYIYFKRFPRLLALSPDLGDTKSAIEISWMCQQPSRSLEIYIFQAISGSQNVQPRSLEIDVGRRMARSARDSSGTQWQGKAAQHSTAQHSTARTRTVGVQHSAAQHSAVGVQHSTRVVGVPQAKQSLLSSPCARK